MAEKMPAAKAGRKTASTKAKTKAETKTKTTTADATPTKPQETETAEQTTPKGTQAIVTAEGGVNVRTSPEKGDNIKRVLPYGAEVTVQAKTTDATGTEWAQIAPHEFIMQRFLRVT